MVDWPLVVSRSRQKELWPGAKWEPVVAAGQGRHWGRRVLVEKGSLSSTSQKVHFPKMNRGLERWPHTHVSILRSLFRLDAQENGKSGEIESKWTPVCHRWTRSCVLEMSGILGCLATLVLNQLLIHRLAMVLSYRL